MNIAFQNIDINLWLVFFIMWGLPLTWFRSRFRKMVYQTDHWWINIKPVFTDEIKALTGRLTSNSPGFIKTRNFYRIYLSVYFLLFLTYQWLS
ncbi:MAG: hypothetical protein ACLFPE_06670 [Bacteroidales bacterium]